ncbi:MAG: ferrochelatase [Candidatus Latescibacterota bacterium]|nr:MAG: ferrochelatase [Candidatus Latescibacterota bacterium]
MRRGILLVNTGSPASPAIKDVRRYLGEFLMDKHVIDIPYLWRMLLVKLLILPSRPRASAEAYRSIWRPDGSPLVAISRAVRARTEEGIASPVALGMRYGSPSITDGLRELAEVTGGKVEEIFLVPLYPHYAMSTTESVTAEVEKQQKKMGVGDRLEVLPPFYNNELYIDALSQSIDDHSIKGYDHLLFSYHGLPERHIRKTDSTGTHCLRAEDCCEASSPAHKTCYRHQVLETTKLVAAKLGLSVERYSVAFQSRLGRDRWLTPNTTDTLGRLAREGIKRLLVVCPSFVTDCLETLEEIGIRGRRTFESAGGDKLKLVPCLNVNPMWIKTLQTWCG